jgi:AraC family transcriptional regulator of adaptative response/methylated-DNA-[protein]-cysteine methyltransferase
MTLPPAPEMYRALETRDAEYDGVFFTAVRTTGIFCRPSCSAKTPKRTNVEFYPSTRDALLAGFRPCKRCRPMEQPGEAPEWLQPVLAKVDGAPLRRWTDADLRGSGVDPTRVRRWFQAHHGMTFHAYQRARRVGQALGQIRHGESPGRAAYDHGFESESGFRDAFKRLFGRTPGQAPDGDPLVITRLVTSLGPMIAGATDDGVCLLEFGDRRMLEHQVQRLTHYVHRDVVLGDHVLLDQLDEELREYFDGHRTEFTVAQQAPGTPFQVACWEFLRSIPYGETRSYEDEAKALRRPNAFRAVGRANGDNRLAILIPCHRVIRGNGELAGYGGGKWRKQSLLDLETNVNRR